MATGEGRFYPANRTLVQQLVSERAEYVVVSRANRATIVDLLANSHLAWEELFSNASYFAVHIERPEVRGQASAVL